MRDGRGCSSLNCTMPSCFGAGFGCEQVGLTAKEVGRLAKRHPDVIEKDAGGHARRIVHIFLQDLQVGKVTPAV